MMKKRGWLILLTIALALVFAFCLYIQRGSAAETNLASFLSFRVFSASGEAEDILCWAQDGKLCYVFLPSYADLSRTEVQLHSSKKLQLGEARLTQGLCCGGFALDTDYELTGEGLAPRILRFVQSAQVAAMYIDTVSGGMERVHRDKSYKEYASISVYTADGQGDYRGDNSDRIRGHGNTTWRDYDKKSYNLYLSQPVSLLKMDEAAEWVLIANALDQTNLRNKLIYDFAASTGTRPGWAPESEYVDLYLNGEYVGLYLLCEKLDTIADKLREDHTLICLNNTIAKLDDPKHALKIGEPLYAEIVAPGVLSENEYARFQAYLPEFTNALSSENWIDYIDLDSFARKYLIEEIFTNTDGGKASQYYYWNQSTNQLYAGPCWDYDLTLGDTPWVDWISPYCLMMQSRVWYKDLWTHEAFREYVQSLYKSEFLPLLNELIESIPAVSKQLEKAANANQIRWNTLYDSSQDSVSLQRFLSERVRFINSLWIDQEAYCKVSFEAKEYTIVPMYVPVNSLGSVIPTPKAMGLEEDSVWYREDTGEPLEDDSIITEDLLLYIKSEGAEEDSGLPAMNFILTLFTLAIFLPLLLLLFFIDYRRNRQGRRRGHA